MRDRDNRLLFQLFRPQPNRRQAVHFGAVIQRGLGGWHIFRAVAPDGHRLALQGAGVGEAQFPGQIVVRVHPIEARGSVIVALTAGKEDDAGNGRGNLPAEDLNGLLGDGIDIGLIGTFVPGQHHAGFDQCTFEIDTMQVERFESAA